MIKELYVEFGGDPSNDKELYKRYCSTEKFDPVGFSDEVIHFVDYATYESLKKELDQVIKIGVEGQREINRKAHEENKKLLDTLNKIGILGMGEAAYTSDFTEKVNSMVRSALGLKERF